MATVVKTPADDLEGYTLHSGWHITTKIQKRIGASGANFGICYLATKGERHAFVKAVDFRLAFTQKDFVAAVAALANHALWEREVMEYCRLHGMSQIVQLIDHEEVLLPSALGDATQRIFCLVMEVGNGDLRGELSVQNAKSGSWKLYVARDVALALDQLHRRGVAHLDVKPSNVIAMREPTGNRTSMKLGDLGRVVRREVAGPFDNALWPGDTGYQPPEKWYGYQPKQWNDNREAADAFMLGSLLVFLFTGVSLTTLLMQYVPDSFKPGVYRGAFAVPLVDVLIQAQAQVLESYVRPALPISIKDELLTVIRNLTHPIPESRGDVRARKQGIVGIDRFHQRLLRMAIHLERLERLGRA